MAGEPPSDGIEARVAQIASVLAGLDKKFDAQSGDLKKQFGSFSEELTEKFNTQSEDLKKQFDSLKEELDERFEAHSEEIKEFKAEVKQQMADLSRDLERIALDVNVLFENRRRAAGIGPYRRSQVAPDMMTEGHGHSSYPWKQRPATPRTG